MSTVQGDLFAGADAALVPRRPWVEVPQATYVTWSTARQVAYCAARDEDTAASPEQDADVRALCAARARAYRRDLAEIVGQTLKASVLY